MRQGLLHLLFIVLLATGIQAQPVETPDGHGDVKVEVQADSQSNTPSQTQSEPQTRNHRREANHSSRAQLRGSLTSLFEDTLLKQGETASDVLTVFGNATIQGDVSGDIYVIGGNLSLNSEVNGRVFVLGGAADFGNNAHALKDVFILGGGFKKAEGADIRNNPVVIGGSMFLSVLLWLKSGLFLGRPVVPSLGWVWGIIFTFLILYSLIALLLRRALAVGAETCEIHPIGSMLTGLLFFIILTSIFACLVFTGIGVVFIPFLLCPVVLLALVGKVVVYISLGSICSKKLRSSGIGMFVALVLGYMLCVVLGMIPFIGFLVWGLTGILGIGTLILSCFRFISRSESKPASTPVMQPSATPPAAPAPVVPPQSPLPSSTPIAATFQPPQPAVALPVPPLVQPPLVSAKPAAPPVPPQIEESAPPVLVTQSHPLAGFWLRTLSLIIDLVLVSGCLAVAHKMWLFPFGLLVYYVSFLAARGSTVGDMIAGIKCVRLTGDSLNWAIAIARSISAMFSAFPLGLGYFWALWDGRKQTWHDKIAGTVMIKSHRGF